MKAASLQLTCSACALDVVVEFEIATADDNEPVTMPEWACPSCRATHQIGVMGRVRAIIARFSPLDLPRRDDT
ncbi:MAG: hypothetical protein ABI634_00145 [Acidobacteriota bacterium]